MSERLAELVEAADLNALLRAVDGLCEARGWDELVELADMCDEALERGKQLWPISAHVDYRLALQAPPDYAASVLDHETSRFSPGPLTEVAASTHTWKELAPHIDSPVAAAYVAQERVLRGEVLTGDDEAHPEVLELPLELGEWEPTYALATYRSDHVEIAEPWEPKEALASHAPEAADLLDEPEIVSTLLDLVMPWTAESNGAARAAVVEGGAGAAISALTMGEFRMGALTSAEAVQRIAWAAASGGAHGRRRGAALGRFMAYFSTSLLGDLEWPAGGLALGRALGSLRFVRWDEGQPEKGWVLRIAVEDRADGWAAALAATDLLEDEDSPEH